MLEQNNGSISGAYETLKTDRQNYVDAAIESAKFTLPPLFLDTDEDQTNELKHRYRTPDSSIGASGLNNLSSTLLLAVFPSNVPFFRQNLTSNFMKRLEEQQGANAKPLKAEIEQSLRKVENTALEILEGGSTRADLYEILRQYLLGQVLIYQNPKDNSVRGFKLNQYVNVRAGDGKVLRYIIQEFIDPANLSEKIQEEAEITAEMLKPSKTAPVRIGMYTDVRLVKKGHWETIQEINGHIIESTRQKFRDDSMPYYDIAFNRILGQQYGSGFIEGLLGDLKAINGLTRSINEGALISARTVFGVNPSSTTSPEELLDTPNGGYIRAQPTDVFAIRVEKNSDYASAFNALSELKGSINVAFMSQFAARRDAERVTAAEFTELAEEINEALGGAFSRLSVELQAPLARLTLKFMRRKNMIKKDIDSSNITKTTIITGISALGRGNDKARINGLLNDLQLAAGVGFQTIASKFDEDELALRMVNSNSINASGLLKSEDQQQQEATAAQQQDSAQQLTDNGVELMKAGIANPEGAQVMGDQFQEFTEATQQEPPQ